MLRGHSCQSHVGRHSSVNPRREFKQDIMTMIRINFQKLNKLVVEEIQSLLALEPEVNIYDGAQREDMVDSIKQHPQKNPTITITLNFMGYF